MKVLCLLRSGKTNQIAVYKNLSIITHTQLNLVVPTSQTWIFAHYLVFTNKYAETDWWNNVFPFLSCNLCILWVAVWATFVCMSVVCSKSLPCLRANIYPTPPSLSVQPQLYILTSVSKNITKQRLGLFRDVTFGDDFIRVCSQNVA